MLLLGCPMLRRIYYDEELDYEFFFDEEGMSNLDLRPEEWAMQGVKIVFQWMAVNPATTKEGDSPFFTLPDIYSSSFV